LATASVDVTASTKIIPQLGNNNVAAMELHEFTNLTTHRASNLLQWFDRKKGKSTGKGNKKDNRSHIF
jgi:hypothetical protein